MVSLCCYPRLVPLRGTNGSQHLGLRSCIQLAQAGSRGPLSWSSSLAGSHSVVPPGQGRTAKLTVTNPVDRLPGFAHRQTVSRPPPHPPPRLALKEPRCSITGHSITGRSSLKGSLPEPIVCTKEVRTAPFRPGEQGCAANRKGPGRKLPASAQRQTHFCLGCSSTRVRYVWAHGIGC